LQFVVTTTENYTAGIVRCFAKLRLYLVYVLNAYCLINLCQIASFFQFYHRLYFAALYSDNDNFVK